MAEKSTLVLETANQEMGTENSEQKTVEKAGEEEKLAQKQAVMKAEAEKTAQLEAEHSA